MANDAGELNSSLYSYMMHDVGTGISIASLSFLPPELGVGELSPDNVAPIPCHFLLCGQLDSQ